jgi:hypothetical protein
LTLAGLTIRYSDCAILAMVANLPAQRLVFVLEQSEIRVTAAIFFGTPVGLPAKYMLDTDTQLAARAIP